MPIDRRDVIHAYRRAALPTIADGLLLVQGCFGSSMRAQPIYELSGDAFPVPVGEIMFPPIFCKMLLDFGIGVANATHRANLVRTEKHFRSAQRVEVFSQGIALRPWKLRPHHALIWVI